MNETERKIVNSIDLDRLIETLSELVAFESSEGREEAIQRFMAARLDELGMEVDLWEADLAALRTDSDYGAEIERERMVGVAGTWGTTDGPKLILNGHVDVVPAEDRSRWTTPPFHLSIRNGRVFGRGCADTKGGLSCALTAFEAVRRSGIRLSGSVVMQSVAAEEDGGAGTLATLVRGYTGDAAIVLEPTGLAIVPAQAGALTFRITIPGRGAHGAFRTEGVNPLEFLPSLYSAISDLERERNQRFRHPLFDEYEIPFPISIGRARAGVWASTVPESLVLEGRFGVAIGEDCEDARGELEMAVARVADAETWLRDHPPKIEWWGARYVPASTPVEHTLVTTLSDCVASVTSSPPPVRGVPYGADMHLLVRRGGIPSVIFGPGDIRSAHAHDESVAIRDLESAAKVLALMIMRFCGTSD